jgi:hypothetical protein
MAKFDYKPVDESMIQNLRLNEEYLSGIDVKNVDAWAEFLWLVSVKIMHYSHFKDDVTNQELFQVASFLRGLSHEMRDEPKNFLIDKKIGRPTKTDKNQLITYMSIMFRLFPDLTLEDAFAKVSEHLGIPEDTIKSRLKGLTKKNF